MVTRESRPTGNGTAETLSLFNTIPTPADTRATVRPATAAHEPGVCVHGMTIGVSCRHCDRERRTIVTAARETGFVHGTSRAALRKVGASELSALKETVLELLAERPMTDDELHAAYLAAGHPTRTRQRIGTARSELAKAGRVIDTGRKSLSALGNMAKVWDVG